MADTATVRLALAACTHAGKAAGASTQRYKRSVLYNTLGYAAERATCPPTRSTAGERSCQPA